MPQDGDGRYHASVLAGPLEKAGLSPDGADYAVTALDNFHDYPTRIAGLPDECKGKSVVYDIRESLEIGPPSFAVDQPWDCHIAFIPAVGTNHFFATNPGIGMVACITETDPAANIEPYATWDSLDGVTGNSRGWNPQGIFVICKALAGRTMYTPQPLTPGGGAAANEYEVVHVKELTDWQRSRLISGAYEIHNTTPELYRGGAITDYSVVDPPTEGFMPQRSPYSANGINLLLGSGTGLTIAAPPTSLAIATQINGSLRDAADGSYVNLKMADVDGFDAQMPTIGAIGFTTDIANVLPATGLSATQRMGFITPTTFTDTPPVTAGIDGNFVSTTYRRLNFIQCGSYLTGLPFQTSLVLSWDLQIENFPRPGTKNMKLAHESAAYDPRALEFVHATQEALPTGVAVKENGSGGWFKDVLNVAKQVSSGLAMIPGPIGAIAGAVNLGTSVASNIADAVDPDERREIDDVEDEPRALERLQRDTAFHVPRMQMNAPTVKGPARRRNRRPRTQESRATRSRNREAALLDIERKDARRNRNRRGGRR